jgi:hypothetical protein
MRKCFLWHISCLMQLLIGGRRITTLTRILVLSPRMSSRLDSHYVPHGTLKLKKKEFSGLQQGSLTVNGYLNRFTQLSRYARDDVNTNEKKQDAFLNGLNDEIQFQLLNIDYEDFQRMVHKAIIVENKFKAMEKNGKRKIPFQGQSSGSNTSPCLPQPGPFFRGLQMMPSPMQGQRHPFQMQRPNLLI